MRLTSSGPAILVTAAFIGPGTVITASRAGADYGLALLWALVFSVLATMILQEMTGRLGIVTKQGLGENIRASMNNSLSRWLAIVLVTSAIVIGNAAYQGGNITGAVLAIAPIVIIPNVTLGVEISSWSLIIGLIALVILWRGQYSLIETSLKLLVGLMSLAFIATFFMTLTNPFDLLSGLIPSIPDGATLTIIALIGTTVVPYNLFLHSAACAEKWRDSESVATALAQSRHDIKLAIPLGGLISIAIMSTAASAFFASQIELVNLATLSPSLEPTMGKAAPYIMATGLFAAGISSAITAPLAAAFALRGILGLNNQLTDWSFRAIWLTILLLGMGVSALQMRPVNIIWFAQVANGLLLPIITSYLIWVMNSDTLGQFKNNRLQNILGLFVLSVALLLSGRSLMSAFGLL